MVNRVNNQNVQNVYTILYQSQGSINSDNNYYFNNIKTSTNCQSTINGNNGG